MKEKILFATVNFILIFNFAAPVLSLILSLGPSLNIKKNIKYFDYL